jgi:hypothetical protein
MVNSFKIAARLKYFIPTIKAHICINEGIKSTLNPENVIQFRIANIRICRLEIYKIQIDKTIILSVVLYGREDFLLAFKKEYIYSGCFLQCPEVRICA